MLLHNKVFIGNSSTVNIPKLKERTLKVFTIKKCHVLHQTQSDFNISYTHVCDICVYICHIYGTPLTCIFLNISYSNSKIKFKNIVLPLLKVPSN